jgi:hypothetical protein
MTSNESSHFSNSGSTNTLFFSSWFIHITSFPQNDFDKLSLILVGIEEQVDVGIFFSYEKRLF